MPHIWTPEEFILNGAFCPSDEFRRQALSLLAQLDGTHILVLVFRKQTFYQSMTLFVDARRPADLKIESTLRHTKISQRGGLRAKVFTNSSKAGPLNELCPALLSIKCFYPLLKVLKPETPMRMVTGETGQGLTVTALVANPNVALGEDSLAEWKRAVLVRASTSLPFYYHNLTDGSHQVESQIAKEEFALRKFLGTTPQPHSLAASHPLRRFAHRVLRLAVNITKSDSGTLFLQSRAGALGCVGKTYAGNVDRVIPALAQLAFEQKKPLLVESEYLGAQDQLPRGCSAMLALTFKQTGSALMRHGRLSFQQGAFAVIVLCKRKNSRAPQFSPTDLAITEGLGRSVDRMKTDFLSAISSTSLANAISGSTLPLKPKNSFSSHSHGVSSEFRAAFPNLQTLLEQAYYITNSLSATVRLLTPDGSFLVRVCGYPSLRLHEPHERIATSDSESVNARVARSGEELYIQSFAKEFQPQSKRVRPDTRSEWCYPLALKGRILGTFNMESGNHDAYAQSLHYLRAVACQISFALLQSRQAESDVLSSMGANQSLSAHLLLKARDDLSHIAHLKPVQKQIGSQLREILTRIDACLESRIQVRHLTPRAYRLIDMGFLDIDALLHAIIEDLDLSLFTELIPSKTPFPLPRVLADPFVLAVSELLENAQKALPVSERVSVSSRLAARGSKTYVGAELSHNVPPEMVSELQALAADLHHCPIVRDDRVHIGALIAGNIARDFGGDIFTVSKGPRLHNYIELPL